MDMTIVVKPVRGQSRADLLTLLEHVMLSLEASVKCHDAGYARCNGPAPRRCAGLGHGVPTKGANDDTSQWNGIKPTEWLPGR